MKKIKTMKDLVNYLILCNKKISTMESCTGGDVANEITNIEGASNIFGFGMVTYSNEYKIKMGVSAYVIDKYSVYSIETSNEMSKKICDFTDSNYGIGITGKLNRVDLNNKFGSDNVVYISIYDRDLNKFYNQTVTVTNISREENKIALSKIISIMLLNIIK